MEGWDLLIESTVIAFHLDWVTKTLHIDVNSPWGNKERKRIVATGIEELEVSEMRLYNIIDRVNLFGAPDSLVNIPKWLPLEKKLSLIRDGSLNLMEIEPVCGASILVLAKLFRLEDMTESNAPNNP